MSTQSNKPKTVPFFSTGYTVNETMRDYSDDPFFKKKDEESQKTLEKVGFPKELLEIIQKRLKK
jgi:hypothetical protein